MKRSSLSYWIVLLTLATWLVSCSPEKFADGANALDGEDTKFTANVIYGTDGRLDIYQVSDARLKAWADSTVALIKSSDLIADGGPDSAHSTVTIRGKNYGTAMNLCGDEKFREQDTAAFCSGTLVGPDLVLTAGHCIEAQDDCQNTSMVFGFAVKSAGALPKTVLRSQVYHCVEIIKTQRVNTGADFALVRLDRAVTNHEPRAVRAEGEVETSSSLVVIGHPVGLPTKITTGGTVRSVASSGFFTANLDSYGGNSGSGVFNLSTGLLEGVLVRGEQDFTTRGSGSAECAISKVCAEGSCRGEDVTRISSVRPFLPVTAAPPAMAPPPVVPTLVPRPALPAPQSFSSTVKFAIPDNNDAGIVSALNVTSEAAGRKVVIRVNITHTFIGDLTVTLLSPDGKRFVLHQGAGGGAHDLVKSFDLTASLGGKRAGTYRLRVQDQASRDTGSLNGWSLDFQ